MQPYYWFLPRAGAARSQPITRQQEPIVPGHWFLSHGTVVAQSQTMRPSSPHYTDKMGPRMSQAASA